MTSQILPYNMWNRIRKNFYLLLIIILIFQTNNSYAQTPQTTINKEEVKTYANWLKYSWLSDYILFDTIKYNNNETKVCLKLICDHDCTARWTYILSAFDSLSHDSFVEYLFTKTFFLLNIKSDSFILEISNTTGEYDSPCFKRKIWFKNVIRVSEANCKDVYSNSMLPFKKLNPVVFQKSSTKTNINDALDVILEYLTTKLEQYYYSKGREIKISKEFLSPTTISFQIENLNNEIIPSNILGLKSIEQLQLIISCYILKNEVEFRTRVNGKFAGNLIKPINLNGYYDMETNQYKDELQKYLDNLTKTKIFLWLK